LESIVFQKRRLHWMYLIALRQAFYGRNLLAFMSYSQRETAIDTAAIGQNGARATLPVVATFFCAGELELLTEKVKQGGARINGEMLLFSIYCELQRDSARVGCGLLDFCDCEAAAANGKAHDRASGEKPGGSNELTPAHRPAVNWALFFDIGIFGIEGIHRSSWVCLLAHCCNKFWMQW
jgi:hypothetical protein